MCKNGGKFKGNNLVLGIPDSALILEVGIRAMKERNTLRLCIRAGPNILDKVIQAG